MSRATKPENIDSATISNAAWGQLRSYLAQQGYSQAAITEIIGDDIGGRDKYTIVQALIEGL